MSSPAVDLARWTAHRAGDPRALLTLLEDPEHRVRPLALRMLGRDQDVDDIVQETYLRASQARFDGRVCFGAYLRRITNNVIISGWRKHRPDSLGESDTAQADSHTSSDPTAEATRRELVQRVSELIPEIRRDWQDVLVLADLQGLSVQECADRLGISYGKANMDLYKARKEIRRLLEGSRPAGG